MNSALVGIGARISEARRKNNMSQNELAERIGTAPSYLSDIETGKTNFGIELFIKITEALQVSADWILRSEIPTVAAINNTEIEELLKGCTQQEITSIIKIVKETKSAIESAKETK